MSVFKYKIRKVRGVLYLYNLSWGRNHPWFFTSNKKIMLEYLDAAGIRLSSVENVSLAKRERLYSRIDRRLCLNEK